MHPIRRPLTGWEVRATQAEIKQLERTIELLAILCELPVPCQVQARTAVESLGKVLKYLEGEDGDEPVFDAKAEV